MPAPAMARLRRTALHGLSMLVLPALLSGLLWLGLAGSAGGPSVRA